MKEQYFPGDMIYVYIGACLYDCKTLTIVGYRFNSSGYNDGHGIYLNDCNLQLSTNYGFVFLNLGKVFVVRTSSMCKGTIFDKYRVENQ
jgi:hypothetical protein